MSDIVWAINPKRDRLTDLVRRMRRLANEVLANRGIQVQFQAPDGTQDPKLGAEVRHDLFLISRKLYTTRCGIRRAGSWTSSCAWNDPA